MCQISCQSNDLCRKWMGGGGWVRLTPPPKSVRVTFFLFKASGVKRYMLSQSERDDFFSIVSSRARTPYPTSLGDFANMTSASIQVALGGGFMTITFINNTRVEGAELRFGVCSF